MPSSKGNASDAFVQAVRDAEDSQSTELNFTHNYELKTIPQEIKLLRPFLQILHIDNCFELKTLHPGIGDLILLRWLNVSYNQLQSLPPEIAKLRNLERLHVNNNAITTIPTEFWGLKNLEEFKVESNRIRALPTGIVFLPKLREVQLENNPLITKKEIEGAEVATMFPATNGGDCSNCNIRFRSAQLFLTFHDLPHSKDVPVVNYVCSEACKTHTLKRLAACDAQVKEV